MQGILELIGLRSHRQTASKTQPVVKPQPQAARETVIKKMAISPVGI